MIVTLGNLYYYPLKLYVFIASYLYFRKLKVIGRKHIPLKGPLIFAINHQNALLDALLLSVISWRNPHFLTRADVFNNKYVDKFLRGLKMLPIYRIRDGYDSIKMNEAIFEATKDILLNGGVVGIFPEGSHSLKYMVRPLKKGIARIAFLAEDAAGFNLDLKIVPIGIQYESHFLPQGRTLISFGKSISVADYKNSYSQNPNLGIEQLINDLRNRLRSLILNFDDTDNYDEKLKLFQSKRVFRKSLQDQLVVDQQLVEAIESDRAFDLKPEKKNLLLLTIERIWQMLWVIIGFLPKAIVEQLLKKTVSDPHFFGTMRFAYSIFVYPIMIFLLYLVVRILLFQFVLA